MVAQAATGATHESVVVPQPRQQQQQPKRRMAVLECEDSERWKGYTESLWTAALSEEGDEWTVYQVCSGQLPSPAEASAFDALLVSGSHYSVYESHAWISQLLAALPQYAATGVRIYGCCFGCQALAQALGGSVGPNPDGNFVLTIEQVTPTQQLSQFKQLEAAVKAALDSTAAAGASPPADAPAPERAAAAARAAAAVTAAAGSSGTSSSNSSSSSSSGSAGDVSSNDGSSSSSDALAQQLGDLSVRGGRGSSDGSNAPCSSSGGCFQLIESHGDQVLTLPPGAVVLASSPTAPFELWCYGSNVLASQFHLEFDEPLVVEKIWTRLSSIGRLDSAQAAASKAALEAGGQHNVQMLQVVKHFLRHGIQ